MQFQVSNQAKLPTPFGTFCLQSFKEQQGALELDHLVVFTQELGKTPLVRVHSECLTGDVFGSQKCDCGGELHMALKRIGKEGGMLVYLRQEGRGIGLFNKINAYALQDQGYDTVEANEAIGFKDDERDYTIVKHIFEHYGLEKIRLLTNNPKKIEAIGAFVQVERCSILVKSNCHNQQYLQTKKLKMGHLL
ncbi:GTP cyclohydrolase II [Helicobacter ailurogastricus]|uniref:GTP cyclohydrolase II n=1 Tax=Helicobacter ailurogastricus TaxID=1578720 RepID=UPI000CF096CF|nr:GTP cyclohydrolase II [Helicobacter ailurogastricus]GLH58203.1 GTP cyclohydrolase II RibA [Helicobacter ailurogastricus]GLH59818.1 GTP cyclohydrolase II RibA [Helicobacter ailurogastricus]GMB90176.1 GTP cyclohydrolase II RibA [Helicobacter ailurogastricus]GMB91765.1 GTP cyclohydrolase II RibA [Helicobacter ailurogastricus]